MDDTDLDEQRREAIAQKKALTDLTDSPGWAMLVATANEQVAARTNIIILTPLDEKWTSSAQEYAKGECAGMRALLAIPTSMLEDASQIVESIDERNDRERSYGDTGDDNPGTDFSSI